MGDEEEVITLTETESPSVYNRQRALETYHWKLQSIPNLHIVEDMHSFGHFLKLSYMSLVGISVHFYEIVSHANLN